MLDALQATATPQTAPWVRNPEGRAVLARPSALRSLHGRQADAASRALMDGPKLPFAAVKMA